MRTSLRLLYLAAALLFAGCAALQPVPPAPEVSTSPAVLALVDQAREESSTGRLEAAGASLERALRIEPRNAVLWQELARIRLDQWQLLQAENLAAKSNALAAGDRHLRAENWRIIGEARSRRGDQQGAQSAFERAGQE